MLRTAFTDLVGVDLPIAGFNRSPAVVAAVCNAGGLGVLAASGYRPDELDAQLTWIEEQTGGRPYGVDLLIPEKFAAGDPGNLVDSLRAQIPDEHLAFVRGLLDRYGVHQVAALDPGHHLGDHVHRDVLRQHGQPAAAGDGLGHATTGHRGHVGRDDRDRGAAAVLRGQVHVEPGGHRGPVRHQEHVAVGQVVGGRGIGKEAHGPDCALDSAGHRLSCCR